MIRNSLGTVIVVFSMFVIGCATIAGDKTQSIPILSTPNEATISVTDEHGREIFKGKTPSYVMLKKSDGSYWGKKSYTVKITKDGYETRNIQITASANGWYIFGNLMSWTLFGWLIVDPWYGCMYTLSPKDITETLSEKTALNAKDGSISILLLEDVPLSLRN